MDQTIEIEVIDPEVVDSAIIKVESETAIAQDDALVLRDKFGAYYETIQEWRVKAAGVTDPENVAHQALARKCRLGLKDVRCDIERLRKALKEESLKKGKAIDGFANVLKFCCEPIEEKLLEVEQYAARKEAARVAAISEDRTRQLVELDCDPTAYNLGLMDEATWVLVLDAAVSNHRNRIEAERKAEADRVAREQADRIARQKAEADAKAARAEAEKERKAREAAEAKAKKEKDAAEAKARKEREKAEATARAEREKAEAAIRKEREAREKAEREAAAARKAEANRIAAQKAAEKAKAIAEIEAQEKAARAPDREKVKRFAKYVREELPMQLPGAITTEEGRAVCEAIEEKIEAFAAWIEKQAEAL